MIDLSEEPEEVASTQNRRASIQGLVDGRGGSKNDPFVLGDSGDESPPNERPIAGPSKKKKKAPKLAPRRTLSAGLKPLEMARVVSASARDVSGNVQGEMIESIDLVSSDDEDMRPLSKDKESRPGPSSATGSQDVPEQSNAAAVTPEVPMPGTYGSVY